MLKLWISGLVLASSAAGAFALGESSQAVSRRPLTAVVPIVERNPLSRCAGGQEAMLEVELPEEAVASAAGESLRAQIKVTNRRGKEGRLKIATELVDDRGKTIKGAVVGDTVTIAARGGRHEKAVAVDPLPDGYYQLRVTAASVADGDADTGAAVLYFKVGSGVVTPLDVNRFLAESAANNEVTP